MNRRDMADLAGFDLAVDLPPEAVAVREDVRAFLRDELSTGSFTPRPDAWLSGHSGEFSRKLGERGWLGMTWPRQYGGHERGSLERFVVSEELLAAGAPVAAHWIADRQTGPLLLRYGSEEQRLRFLPSIATGETYFALGMSEPDSGSDLASVRTRGTRTSTGWRITGTKVWISHAHRSHYLTVLARIEPLDTGDRHAGLTQFVVDLSSPGVTVNPIALLDGERHFNEVVLDEVEVGDEEVIGQPGSGWEQVTSELAYERSGPERFLSTFLLFAAMVEVVGSSSAAEVAVGELWAELWSLRRLSLAIASALHHGKVPEVPAAMVKDLGTRFENKVINVARAVVTDPHLAPERYQRLLRESVLHAPGFTLRGGTNEILRGIVARRLGLR